MQPAVLCFFFILQSWDVSKILQFFCFKLQELILANPPPPSPSPIPFYKTWCCYVFCIVTGESTFTYRDAAWRYRVSYWLTQDPGGQNHTLFLCIVSGMFVTSRQKKKVLTRCVFHKPRLLGVFFFF